MKDLDKTLIVALNNTLARNGEETKWYRDRNSGTKVSGPKRPTSFQNYLVKVSLLFLRNILFLKCS